MSEMTAELRDALRKPFDPGVVREKKGQGGRMMDYVSHGAVTKRLNDVAPGWKAVMVERYITGEGDKLHCLGGVMQMTIAGVTREEAGGPTRLGTLADDLKNTYSDCLKRCAMRFGVALDMWESAEENDEDAQPGNPLDQLLAAIKEMDETRTSYPEIVQHAKTKGATFDPADWQRVQAAVKAIGNQRKADAAKHPAFAG